MAIRHAVERLRTWLATRPAARRPERRRLGVEGLETRLAPAANLVPISLTAPPVVVPGQGVSISYSVANTGSTATPVAAWKDVIVLSADARFDATDVVLATVPRTGALAAGRSYTRAVSGIVPASMPANARLLVFTDSTGLVAESSNGDNARSMAVAPADAALAALAGSATSVLGAPLTVTASDATSVTLEAMPGKVYSLGGFRLTDIAITLAPASATPVAGSAKVHVPVSAGTLAVPVSFALDGGQLRISGAVTVSEFRLGAEPAALAAADVTVAASVTIDLAAGAVSGSVGFTAARAVVAPTSAAGLPISGRIALTGVSGSITSAGRFAVAADEVRLTVPNTLTATADDVTLAFDPASPNAALVVISAVTVTSPRFPGASAVASNVTVTRAGFTIPSATLEAASLTVDPRVSLTNLRMTVSNLVFNRATGFTAGVLSATAARADLLGGAATADGVSFTFNLQTGAMAGRIATLNGAIGPVTVTASAASLNIDADATTPLVGVASATLSLPGAANLTVTGFRLEPDGRFSFAALAGLALPGLTNLGPQATGSFRGDVRTDGSTTLVRLTGSGTAFGVPIQLDGELTALSSGLAGGLRLESSVGGRMPVLGTSLGFAASGEGFLLVNKTGAARAVSVAGFSRTLAAGAAAVVIDGQVAIRGFELAGVFDLVKNGNTIDVRADATLDIGGFGSYRMTPSGSFAITSGGVVGSVLLDREAAGNGLFTVTGDATLRLNTTAAASQGIPANVVEVRVSGGIRPTGMPQAFAVGGAVSIGFKDNAGSDNDFFFAKLTSANSLRATVFGVSVRFAGEMRSNGHVDVSGTWATGINTPVGSAAARLTIRVTRNADGDVSFRGSGTVTVSTGLGDVVAAARLDAAGRLTFTFNGVAITVQL